MYYNDIFNNIAYEDTDGNEVYSARDLQKVLEYSSWDEFKKVIDKSIIHYANTGLNPAFQFTNGTKIVEERELPDIWLTSHACYVIVQNAVVSDELKAIGLEFFDNKPNVHNEGKYKKRVAYDEFKKRVKIKRCKMNI